MTRYIPTPKPAELDPVLVRDISEKVYRLRLDDGGEGMVAKDGDGGEKLRNRSGAYDPLTRAYMRILKENSHA